MKYIIALLVFLSLNCADGQTNNFDHSLFDSLLNENVDENGLVRYESFIDNKEFDEYLLSIKEAHIEKLSEEEEFAFLVNAYNALVIKNVLDHWQINSPMDVDGFFDKYKFFVAGKELTLNQLEYDLVFKIDPVLCHFGLVCAGKSCPKLLPKAYTGEDIIDQLELNARHFLQDKTKNRLDKENNILYLSEIFKWFIDIFTEKYGSVKAAAMNFMSKDDSDYIKENEIVIKYIRYNWELNKQ